MARISLDDQFFGDARIKYLAQVTGEAPITTEGRLARLYWDSVSNLAEIRSAEEIDLHAMWFHPSLGSYADLLVKSQLAERVGDNQYRIRGVANRMAWLEEKVRAASNGGKKSTLGRRRDSSGRLLPKQPPSTDPSVLGVLPSTHQASSNVLVLDPVLDLVPAIVLVQKPSSGVHEAPTLGDGVEGEFLPVGTRKKRQSPNPENTATWEAYRDAYNHRYKTDPVRNASVNAQIASLVKRIGRGETPKVAAFYLTHNDQFYVKAMHSIGLLLRDAEKLRTEWVTNVRMLGSQARDIERMQHSSNVWDDAFAAVRERSEGNEAIK